MRPLEQERMRKKTSERYKAARLKPPRLDALHEMCRGLEIVRFEQERILQRVSHDEALNILLESDLAKKYREIGRASIIRARL
jgi:hypothetical protein